MFVKTAGHKAAGDLMNVHIIKFAEIRRTARCFLLIDTEDHSLYSII